MTFWRLVIERASFNGGFGKAYAMTAKDFRLALAD